MAWPGVTLSSSAKTACLISMRSGTASTTKSTSAKPSYSVVPVMSAILRSSSSGVIFSRSTRCCQRDRAFSRPWSTNSGLTSFSTTGMSTLAMVQAISPPIVPAPTTAALNTNMCRKTVLWSFRGAGRLLRLERELGVAVALARVAAQRAPQRVAQRATDEQQVGDEEQWALALEVVLELELDDHPVALGAEGDPLTARELLVLDLGLLTPARLVAEHALEHPAPALGPGLPDQHAPALGPAVLALDYGAEAVDPRRPAVEVVPERLGLG